MKSLLISSLFILLSFICFGQTKFENKIISGTWINAEFLNCLRTCDSVSKRAIDIHPRFVYIDSALTFQYENHFEHISRKDKLIYKSSTDQFISKDKGANLQLVNDSTLAFIQNGRIQKLFRKIGVYAVPGSGMQIYLRTLYFTNKKFWKLIHIDQTNKIDTQSVIVTATKILSLKRKYISEYEFMDTHQETLKDENLFTVMFFDVDKSNMMINERLFIIKKIGVVVNLYNKEKLEYILIPENEP